MLWLTIYVHGEEWVAAAEKTEKLIVVHPIIFVVYLALARNTVNFSCYIGLLY